MLGICTHFMQGTPYIYQGEELGMTNPGFTSIDDFDDVESKYYYRTMIEQGKSSAEALRIVNERSRDDGRTPMQWSAAPHAGFTTGEPWLGVCANYPLVNAEVEADDPDSMLNFYRSLVKMRKSLGVVAHGRVRFMDAGPAAPKVIAYERTLADAPAGQPSRLIVLCSFDDEPCAVRLVGDDARGLERAERLVGNYGTPLIDAADGMVALHPFEALVLAVQ